MALPVSLLKRLADFHLGAPVFSSNGRHVGSLHRVVIDRDSWDPHQVIVKESVRFNGHLVALYAGLTTDELIVPIAAIAQISRTRVDLSLTSKQLRRLPPYLSYHLAPVGVTEASVEVVSAGLGGPRLPREVESADKSSDDIEVRAGENVMLGHEGQKLGHVQDVLFDEGEFAGIVVHPIGFFEHDILVQVRFLERSDDGALFVHMTPDDIQHLPPFHPEHG
jgi:uncharacterized protein YrrD